MIGAARIWETFDSFGHHIPIGVAPKGLFIKKLGPANGILKQLLHPDYRERLTASNLGRELSLWSPGVQMSKFASGGETTFEGRRGTFQVLFGDLSSELLQWLVSDPDFIQYTKLVPENSTQIGAENHLEWDSSDGSLVKAELFGKAKPLQKVVNLNGKTIRRDLPSRLLQWLQAMTDMNKDSIEAFDSVLSRLLGDLSEEQLSKNGTDLLKSKFSDWWPFAGSVQFMLPTNRSDPTHIDGSAGVWHLGLSLYGCRTLVLHTTDHKDGVLHPPFFPLPLETFSIIDPRRKSYMYIQQVN